MKCVGIVVKVFVAPCRKYVNAWAATAEFNAECVEANRAGPFQRRKGCHFAAMLPSLLSACITNTCGRTYMHT